METLPQKKQLLNISLRIMERKHAKPVMNAIRLQKIFAIKIEKQNTSWTGYK